MNVIITRGVLISHCLLNLPSKVSIVGDVNLLFYALRVSTAQSATRAVLLLNLT